MTATDLVVILGAVVVGVGTAAVVIVRRELAARDRAKRQRWLNGAQPPDPIRKMASRNRPVGRP